MKLKDFFVLLPPKLCDVLLVILVLKYHPPVVGCDQGENFIDDITRSEDLFVKADSFFFCEFGFNSILFDLGWRVYLLGLDLISWRIWMFSRFLVPLTILIQETFGFKTFNEGC